MKEGFWVDTSLVLSAVIVASHLLMILCFFTVIYQISYIRRKLKTVNS